MNHREEQVLRLVKERLETKLEFEYTDWDDLIEMDGFTEDEIERALGLLEIQEKSQDHLKSVTEDRNGN